MSDWLQKSTARRTLQSGLLVIGYILVAFFVLYLVDTVSTLTLNGAGWCLLLFLTIIWLVQWIVHLYLFSRFSSEDGEKVMMSKGQWGLSFLPSVVLLLAIVIVYAALHDVEFFAVSASNFMLAFFIWIFVIAALGILTIVISLALPKRPRAREVVMKVVGADDPDVAAALGSYPHDGAANPASRRPAPAGGAGLTQQEVVFPDLVAVDEQYRAEPYVPAESADVSLSQLCVGFNRYLETKGMFYAMETIRSFVAGMACSHLLILEGLSGMGKTSLPRYFAEYIGANVNFTSVQSSWRDRSDVLGYYNDFVGQFKETPFLRALYRANYETKDVNLLVLDEMNLSRVEYYFADFLSVLELDESQWKIELMPVSTGGTLPARLRDCSIAIPTNVWFVGTANKDDSTYAITDKVYDRAIVIDFVRRKEDGSFKGEIQPLHLGSDRIAELFASAASNEEYRLSAVDFEKFKKLADFMYDIFDVSFGNRILNQIVKFVPVYVACGGTAAKALDLMFSRKVMRKLEGRFDDEMKDNLDKLEKLVLNMFGKKEFSETLEVIARLKRKML